MKVIETRTLSKNDLRTLCDRMNWCHDMNKNQFTRFLNVSCNKKHITSAQIIQIAVWVYQGGNSFSETGKHQLQRELSECDLTVISLMADEISKICKTSFSIV